MRLHRYRYSSSAGALRAQYIHQPKSSGRLRSHNYHGMRRAQAESSLRVRREYNIYQRKSSGRLRSHYYHGIRRAQVESSLRVRREHEFRNQGAAEAAELLLSRRAESCAGKRRRSHSIKAGEERKSFMWVRREHKYRASLSRQTKSANHFCGCGESTSFTTKEQQEAAEPFYQGRRRAAQILSRRA